jgi:dimeric dUTPase (all-alpha-NTP-PPase superfamily)
MKGIEMESSAFNRTYLPLLLESFKLVETEIETLESYITEENFDEFFQEYVSMQQNLSLVQREIVRVGKKLGMRKEQIRNLINQ